MLTYEISIDGNISYPELTQTEMGVYVEAYKNYSIEVRAINSQKKSSVETKITVLTISTGIAGAVRVQ